MFNNFLREGHGVLAAGSHTGNGIQDVLFEDTVMNHIDMAFRFKSAPTNGGFAANITMRDCAVADTNQGWVLTTSYSDPNSASSTEAAEIGQFYNFAAYNVSVYGAVQNTICVYADVDPVSNPQKPWHTHHNLYFQDITFGNVGGNGGYKYYSGWDTLTGCENSVFYNVKTVSYNKKAVDKKTNNAWSNIKYSKNVIFQGTTLDSVNACVDKMKDAMSGPVVTDTKVNSTSADNGQSAELTWAAASDASGSVYYGVDTYVAGEKVDSVDGIKETKATMTGLSSGVAYTFKVYVSDETGNKTELGQIGLTTKGEKDTAPIKAVADSTVEITNPVYTCAQATWNSASLSDARVRGYKVYVNGSLNNTIYNYQVPKHATAETVSKQVGRLTPGKANDIRIVAFTDAGVEYEYTAAVANTLDNYDYKAPVFASGAAITTEVKDNGDVVLAWPAATDDTAVGGYRVYVDGKAVTPEGSDEFNPVNGAKTTKDTTYTISGLDLTVEHTFTVQAGDSWWKAETTMGTYDKMAGFNWTVKGLSAELGVTFDQFKTDDSDNVLVDVSADRGVIPNGSSLVVNDIISVEKYESIKTAVEDKKFKVLNVTINDADGLEVTPSGKVNVSIALPEGYNKDNTKVYLVQADGTMTDMNAVYEAAKTRAVSESGKLVFATSELGTFAVVDETAAVKPDDNNGDNNGSAGNDDTNNGSAGNDDTNNGNAGNDDANNGSTGNNAVNNDDSSINTGDNNIALLYVGFMALAIMAGGIVLLEKKKARR